MKSIFFCIAIKLFEPDKLYLFLLSGGIQIDDDEELKILETYTKLISCT